MEKRVKGRVLVAGQAQGLAVISILPISFWGGVNPHTGEIIDRRHDRSGTNITGKIFAFPAGKGSSTSSAVLMEGIRNGTAPAGIIMKNVDPILTLGAIVAEEMYQRTVPMLILAEADFNSISEGDTLTIELDGTVIITQPDKDNV